MGGAANGKSPFDTDDDAPGARSVERAIG